MNQPQVIFNIIDILKQYPQINTCTITLSTFDNKYIVMSDINFTPYFELVIDSKISTKFTNEVFAKRLTQEQKDAVLFEYNIKVPEMIAIAQALQVERGNIKKDRTYYYRK